MPTDWKNSHVDQLRTLSAKRQLVDKAASDIRQAIDELRPLPDAAKLLTAVAADVMDAVQKRNDRRDVNAACSTLRAAIAALEAVGINLDG